MNDMSMTLRTLPSAETVTPAILIVDDDPDISLVLHDLLEHAGYRVQVAGTGAEALARARADSFAAVLLDLMLPDMDGLSVLTLLEPIDPVLPVIMLTAFVEVAKKHGSLTEGAFGYLTKPYDGEELKALIQRAVKDPRVSEGLVSITEVIVTPDLKHATVYVSHLGEQASHKGVLEGLQHAAPFLHSELGRRLKMRSVPLLRFELDPSIERGAHLASLIAEAVRGRDTSEG